MPTRTLFRLHIDLTELDREQTYNYTIAGVPRSVRYWTVHSRPDMTDSDGDGVFDNQDTAPLKFGVLDPDGRLVVGALKIFAYTKNPFSQGPAAILGHSFLAYTSYVRDDVDFWGIRMSTGDPGYPAYREDDVYDDDSHYPSWNNLHLEPNEFITLGTFMQGIPDYKKGTFINMELFGDYNADRSPNGLTESYQGQANSWVTSQASLMNYVTAENLTKLTDCSREFSRWTRLENCSVFSSKTWNEVFSDDLDCTTLYFTQNGIFGSVALPEYLMWSIKARKDANTDDVLKAERPSIV